MPHRPEDVQRTHAVETLGGLARDIAHPVAVFYRALRDEGLSPEDARAITGEFIAHLLGQIPKP
ncbi:MAG: hypothetical protein HEQ38_17305 [Gemmatimonas sp.]|nr:hypothetical protein [Gemmatimonas sp.]